MTDDKLAEIKAWRSELSEFECGPLFTAMLINIDELIAEVERLRAELETTKRCLYQAQEAAKALTAAATVKDSLTDPLPQTVAMMDSLEVDARDPQSVRHWLGKLADAVWLLFTYCTTLRAELAAAQERLKLAEQIIRITAVDADENWTLLREWRAGR